MMWGRMTRVQHLTIKKKKAVECWELTCFDVSRAAPSSPHIAHGLLTPKHERKTIEKDKRKTKMHWEVGQGPAIFKKGFFGSREVSSVFVEGIFWWDLPIFNLVDDPPYDFMDNHLIHNFFKQVFMYLPCPNWGH